MLEPMGLSKVKNSIVTYSTVAIATIWLAMTSAIIGTSEETLYRERDLAAINHRAFLNCPIIVSDESQCGLYLEATWTRYLICDNSREMQGAALATIQWLFLSNSPRPFYRLRGTRECIAMYIKVEDNTHEPDYFICGC